MLKGTVVIAHRTTQGKRAEAEAEADGRCRCRWQEARGHLASSQLKEAQQDTGAYAAWRMWQTSLNHKQNTNPHTQHPAHAHGTRHETRDTRHETHAARSGLQKLQSTIIPDPYPPPGRRASWFGPQLRGLDPGLSQIVDNSR
jgi:hypothetical protein